MNFTRDFMENVWSRWFKWLEIKEYWELVKNLWKYNLDIEKNMFD